MCCDGDIQLAPAPAPELSGDVDDEDDTAPDDEEDDDEEDGR